METTLSPLRSITPVSTQPESSSSPSSSEIARQLLVKFAAITGKPAERAQFELWDNLLSDLPPDRLEAAGNQLLRTWRFPNLPMPGDVRAQIEEADETSFQLTAETEWRRLLDWIRENYFPDGVGVRKGAPSLPAAVEHAAKAAGGFKYIERCSEENLVWCRKTFLTAYRNVYEAGQVQHLLTDREAKRVWNQLKAGSERNQLAPVRSSANPSNGIPRDEVRETLQKITVSPEPPELPTEAEWQARKDRLKRSALEWAAERGLGPSTVSGTQEGASR